MAKASKAIIACSKACNKKGKIKGDNKKQKKILRSQCQHHIVKKNGKIKTMAFPHDNDGYLYCKMCGERFPAKLYTPEEIDALADNINDAVNQLKFVSAAAGAGEKCDEYVTKLAVMLRPFRKTMKKTNKLVSKSKKLGKKNKHKDMPGQSTQGTWGVRG